MVCITFISLFIFHLLVAHFLCRIIGTHSIFVLFEIDF